LMLCGLNVSKMNNGSDHAGLLTVAASS
jgi:hypothetical protein